ncbi:Uncharacterized protein dnm_009990 [Desulfonema magnum]|uniref:Uncharacterized protein n=1 Tax=Desulfonema magnum TaxID=45655 RepID=A0A975BGS3_9BACT|nr:Uncharacterized protein dnm_009990 [Desulfonema magnum]
MIFVIVLLVISSCNMLKSFTAKKNRQSHLFPLFQMVT